MKIIDRGLLASQCKAINTFANTENQITALGGKISSQARRTLLELSHQYLPAEVSDQVELMLRRADHQTQNS